MIDREGYLRGLERLVHAYGLTCPDVRKLSPAEEQALWEQISRAVLWSVRAEVSERRFQRMARGRSWWRLIREERRERRDR